MPVDELKESCVPLALPKVMVEDAESPWVRRSKVEVELAAVPKLVVGVNGNEAAAQGEPVVVSMFVADH